MCRYIQPSRLLTELIVVPVSMDPKKHSRFPPHPNLTGNKIEDGLVPGIRLDIQCFHEDLRSSGLFGSSGIFYLECDVKIFVNDEPCATYSHDKTWVQHNVKEPGELREKKSVNLTFFHVKWMSVR